jgi:acyl carrier protein
MKDKNKIKDDIWSILDNHLQLDVDYIETSDSIHNQLDSIDLIDLVMEIEKSYEVSIPDNVVEGFNTYDDIINYLANL